MNNSSTRAHKRKRVLKALLSGRSFNRFEAERELNDHCLNSTISEIGFVEKVIVSRCWETVPGYQGIPTRVKRYWVKPEHRQGCLNG